MPNALLHAHNLKWTQMSGGLSQWHLSAREASYSHDKTSLVLTDAELSMVSKDGKNVEVTAPRRGNFGDRQSYQPGPFKRRAARSTMATSC